mmetsp:Transcript_55617/g.97106  ORF Transcript_55617/g.97106 Transcript_55617/m.97106 type:complete len:125 (-) Transcript_55617:28-402(-)
MRVRGDSGIFAGALLQVLAALLFWLLLLLFLATSQRSGGPGKDVLPTVCLRAWATEVLPCDEPVFGGGVLLLGGVAILLGAAADADVTEFRAEPARSLGLTLRPWPSSGDCLGEGFEAAAWPSA